MTQNPKTVVILGDFAQINGGQAKVAVETARLLAGAGIAVHFVAAGGEPDAALDHPGITLEVFGQADILSDSNRLRAMARGIWNRDARARLDRIVTRFDPRETVLHCHGYAKALSPSIGPVLTDGPLPAVYTMHEYFLGCPNGGFYDYKAGEICRRRAMGPDCLTTDCDVRHMGHKVWRVARQAATWGPGRMPRGLRHVIYISEVQRRAMAPYMAPSTRLHHVANPVASEGQERVDASGNDTFVFLGRMSPEKGASDFARAAAAAKVRALFIGDGAEAEEVRRIYPAAEVTGWVDAAQATRRLREARALVIPSRWQEPFGLVAYEALNCGIPVVTGRWNAAAELFEDGVAGIAYEQNSTEALVKAMHDASRLPPFDPAPYRAQSSPAVYLERLLAVYRAVLSDRGAASLVAQ